MKWLPLLAFALFFMNVNFTFYLTHYVSFIVLVLIMIVLFLVAVYLIRSKQLKTLLLLQEQVDKKCVDDKVVTDVATIFMAVLLGFPGFASAIVAGIVFLSPWRRQVTLWLLSLLHL